MPPVKRPRPKTTKRPAKPKPPKKGALIHFTASHKVAAHRKPKADGGDGGVWVLIGPISWLQRKNGKINSKIKTAALKAFRKFKKG